jgi:hypothetical protein
MVSITFPAVDVTLNVLVEAGLGCLHCIEARFDSGWYWCSHYLPPLTILLSMSSPSSAYCKRCCKDGSIRLIFFDLFLGTHRGHTFQNFKRSCIMLYGKPWEHPSAAAKLSTVVLLSAPNLPTHCRVASGAISTWRPGRASSATFEISLREFLDPVLKRFTRQTLPTVTRKYFFLYEYHSHWVILPTKSITERFFLVVHPSSVVATLTTETSLWTWACVSATYTHKAGLCCYLVIHIGNLLHPLELFYFQLWPIYWLSLVFRLCRIFKGSINSLDDLTLLNFSVFTIRSTIC